MGQFVLGGLNVTARGQNVQGKGRLVGAFWGVIEGVLMGALYDGGFVRGGLGGWRRFRGTGAERHPDRSPPWPDGHGRCRHTDAMSEPQPPRSHAPVSHPTVSHATPPTAAPAPDRAAPPTPPLRALGLLAPFLRPYRGRVVLALVLLLLAAGATLVFPLALRDLVDSGLAAGRTPADASALSGLTGHVLALFGVAAALGVFSAARFYLVSDLGERVTADVREAVYRHVLLQDAVFFETTRPGEVLSRLTTDTTVVQTVVGSSLSMGLRSAVMGLGALAMLAWHHPVVVLGVGALVVGVVWPAWAFGRRVRRLSRDSQDRVADVSALAGEVLGAMHTVQALGAAPHEAQRFGQAAQAALATARRRSRARALLVGFVMVSTSGLVIWGLHQGMLAVLAGRLSAGELSQAALYGVLLASAAAVLGEVYGDVLRAAGAMERLMELLGQQPAIRSPHPAAALPQPASGRGAAVAFEGVTFHYPSRPAQAALHDVSWQALPGQTVALVGPSGAGKSTVFGLLMRFHDVQQGCIRLNGVPIHTVHLDELRRSMGWVPQDPVMFSASARDNIRYGHPDASDDAVRHAARLAQADGFISALPQGYDTPLGERGVRLSGGQRQRIAIARALLGNPPLLVLDEATSALDTESEQAVQRALQDAMRGRTTLVIAHRLATVLRADRIVVLDHGRVVEQGTHTELVQANGLYARLASLQFDSHL